MKFPIINIYVHFFFLRSRKLTTFAHILNKKSVSFFFFFFFFVLNRTAHISKSG